MKYYYRKSIVLGLLCLTSVVLAGIENYDPNEINEFYLDLQNARTIEQMSNPVNAEDFGDKLEEKWRMKVGGYYAQVVLAICGSLQQSGIDENRFLQNKYSELALENLKDDLINWPLKFEIGLLVYARKNTEKLSELSQNSDWSVVRGKIAKPYLHALGRLRNSLSKSWDINNSSPHLVKLPEMKSSIKEINDPAVREHYKEKIMRLHEQKEQYNKQYELRRLQEQCLPIFYEYLRSLFSRYPPNSQNFESKAFQEDLNRHVPSTEERKGIFDMVNSSRENLYSLRQEKVNHRDISEQISFLNYWVNGMEQTEDKQMWDRICFFMETVKQAWIECENIVNSGKMNTTCYQGVYGGKWTSEEGKTQYRFELLSGAREIHVGKKYVYSDRIYGILIPEKSYKITLSVYGYYLKSFNFVDMHERVIFYPNNKVKEYYYNIDNDTWFRVSWDETGKIKEQGVETFKSNPKKSDILKRQAKSRESLEKFRNTRTGSN